MRERENSRPTKGTSGFTLIEVLLVVAILGILAAVVVVNVSGRREATMIQAARVSISGISTAIKLYEVDTGRFPPSLQSLVSSDGAPNWSGPYVDAEALLDPWGVEFTYSSSGGARFKVSSAGPDMAHGGGDDITN